MLVLGIESTCDETAFALVEGGKRILAQRIASQADLHKQFGGVFPELASRRHFEIFLPLLKEMLGKAHVSGEEIDLIAVAQGPGLIGSLLIGLNGAKALALGWGKPLVGVNHVEAHLYASMMEVDELLFPALGVVVSGGHTFLVRILGIGEYEPIGGTVDDAIGEAFDKVASLLGLPYPGGPGIEELAKRGNRERFLFQRGRVKERKWDFSFSGLKTNVLYTVKGANATKNSPLKIAEDEKPHIAAAFQETALSDVVDRAALAAKEFGCRAIFVGGGVSNNQRFREMFAEKNLSIPLFWPPKGLSLDNAAMIAGLGFHLYQKRGKGNDLTLEPYPRQSLL